MAQRLPTLKPTVIVGTNISGVGINTGQLMHSYGGQAISSGGYSGAGAVRLHLGAGRLDTAQIFAIGAAAPAGASGQPVIFYDANVAGTGYIPGSGHRILAVLDPKTLAQQAFGNTTYNSGAVMLAGLPVQLGIPFSSGLCAQALSGAPGYVATYTPVVSGGSQEGA